MTLLESFFIALSTYSAVPVPQFDWNDQNMKYAICFFPFVGVLCGAALWGWIAISKGLGFGAVLFAAVAVCLPILISGGIHMDGFMDTVDALASHNTRERKLEILKDPNCGAFAVVYAGVWFLLCFGILHELFLSGNVLAACPVFVMSRALSGLCVVNMPNARGAGMLCAFTEHAGRVAANVALGALLALGAGAAVVVSPGVGLAEVLVAVVWALVYCRMAMREFGGVTGDTSGFFLEVCELACFAGALVRGRLL